MSTESEKTNHEQVESKRSLAATLYSKLELAQMFGGQLVSIFLLKEMLTTLKQAGILNNEQIEGILSNTSAEVARVCQNYLDSITSDKLYSATDIQKMNEIAEYFLTLIRDEVVKTT